MSTTEHREAMIEHLSSRLVRGTRKLQAHLHQDGRNRVAEANDQLRAATRVLDMALQGGTLDPEAMSELMRGMAELIVTTEREFRAQIAEDNRVVDQG